VQAARVFHCTHCGAGLSLQGAALAVRCGYCQTDNQVPRPLLNAMRDARAQQVMQELQATQARQQQAASEAMPLMAYKQFAVTGALSLALVGMSLAMSPALSLKAALRMAMTPLAMVSGGVAWAVIARGNKRRRLQQMALARDSAGHGASCAQCGAALVARGDDPTVRCAHCQTVSVLPASVLNARAAERQRIVLAERDQALKSSARAIQNSQLVSVVVFAIMAVGAVLGFVLG
jgi:DNA-directed RNA polymerase subunit RPC12/RpoP